MTERDGTPRSGADAAATEPEAPLDEQDVVLTVPASFNEVARELTVREGSVWTEQGLLAVPAGCRAAVERAWQPGPMVLPACEPELAAVTTTPPHPVGLT